jgi:uncharacterized protein (TIGR02145 family)
MAAASSVGIPIYMHWENSDVEESDSYTEESLESADSSGYVYYPSDYDKALLELPSDIDCVYGVNIKESSGETLIKKFITNEDVPNTTFLAAGIWFFQTYVRCSSVFGLTLKVTVYKRDWLGTETELFSITHTLDDDEETPKSYKFAFVADNYVFNKTDRLVFAYSASNSKEIDQTIELFVEGITPTNVRIPFSLDVLKSELGGLNEVITDMSVQGNGKESDPITLVNDEETPGVSKYYGTDKAGDKGYHALPKEVVGTVSDIKYGHLFNQYAVEDVRGLAPIGWRVATASDWDALSTYFGGGLVSGGALKEQGLEHWLVPNTGATNESGFSGRGAGLRVASTGVFINLLDICAFWSSTAATYYMLGSDDTVLSKTTSLESAKPAGYSVRYIKEDSNDPGSVVGNDGKIYSTVKINGQVWTIRNSAETKYRNGDDIPGPLFEDAEWAALESGAYCVYDDNEDNAGSEKIKIEHNKTDEIQGGNEAERYHTTKDENDAIIGANNPSADNPFATMADIPESGEGGIDDIYVEPDPTFPIDYLYYEKDSVPTFVTDIPKADGVVAGGHISWLGGLTYQIDPTAWYKAGELYTIDTSVLTLDPANSGQDRIDAMILDIVDGFTFITGTPAESPMRPTVDAGTDIFLTEVYIAAGDDEPTPVPTDEIVYNENVEWTVSASGPSINPDYTGEHYQGSKSIDVGSIGNFEYIQFESGTSKETADWESIIVNLKLKSTPLDTRKSRLAVQFLLNGVAICNPTNFTISGSASGWQNLALMFSRINFFSGEFNQIRLYFYKTTGGDYTGFYLDYIKLEAGVEQPVLNQSVILTGDVTGSGVTGSPIPTTLKTVNSNVGQFGGATSVPKITVDEKGRVTAVESVDITPSSGSDEKVKLTADDPAAGYLTPKMAGVDAATVDDTSTFNFIKTVEDVVSLVKITWSNLKAALKTYFDGLYYAFGIYEDIAFDFNDITAGTAQTYYLDRKVSFAYTIESCVLESDGTLTGVSIKIGSTAVGAMDNLSVSAIAETAATSDKTTAAGDAVTLNTSTGYSGTPTLIRGKLKLKRVAS